MSRNGPPDAVRIRADADAIASPTRHCQIAECSESIGRSQASGLANGSTSRRAAAARRGERPGLRHDQVPAGDQGLLVGRRDDLAGGSAARTGRQAHRPRPSPITTRSTSSRVASSTRAFGPADPRRAAWKVEAADSPRRRDATTAGRSWAACSASSVPCVPVASATTRNASGCARAPPRSVGRWSRSIR